MYTCNMNIIQLLLGGGRTQVRTKLLLASEWAPDAENKAVGSGLGI